MPASREKAFLEEKKQAKCGRLSRSQQMNEERRSLVRRASKTSQDKSTEAGRHTASVHNLCGFGTQEDPKQ